MTTSLPEVIVYTKPSCPQCTATKRALTAHGVEFEEADLLGELDAAEAFRAYGVRSAPVVVSSAGVWGGYVPDALRLLY